MASVPELRPGAPKPARRSDWRLLAAAALLLGAAGCGGSHDATARAMALPGNVDRGRVVFALAGGCGCHTPKDGPIGSGGVEIATPFGTFFSTNVTGDRTTGIGAWSDADVERAIRAGELPDGSVESPVMPYYAYRGMADQDVRNLIAYLRTLAPAARENRPARVDLPLPRLAYRGWRLLFADRGEAPTAAPAEEAERGKYLTEHVSVCGDCHTPRNRLGAVDRALLLAGVSEAPGAPYAPNITPDPETGIGKWDRGDIASLLQTGFKPDFDNVQGRMAEVIDGIAGGSGYAKAPQADLIAIAGYLKTVPPIHRRVTSEAGDSDPAHADERGG
jgi:mono/diheme cytochrome c family protein